MPALVHKLLAAAPAAEPDADLLARFVAARDDDAFAELVRRHGPVVYHTCRRLVGPSAADDAFQATFLVLAARAGSVRKAASVGSWLVGVAGRVGRRMGQRDRRWETGNRRRGTGDRGQETGDERHADSDCSPSPVPCSPSPVSCLLSRELCEVLTDEFTRLPDRLRAAAVACLMDGRTQEQAAAALGWSSRTVRRRLDEAKGLLRTRLERRGVTPAAAVAAVGAAGEAVAALPAGLARRASDGATLFLAGGGAHVPAAALAHGVIGTMRTLPAPAAVAACVVVMTGLGLGWANDATQPPADVPTPAAKSDPDRIPAPTRATPKPPPTGAAVHTHKTANFVVAAPSEVVARSIGDEFERQRKVIAVEWLGKELPDWREPVKVEVQHLGKNSYAASFRFKSASGAEINQGYSYSLDRIRSEFIPAMVTRVVLVTQYGKRLPLWAEEGITPLSSERDVNPQWSARVALRHLEDGMALRLAALFRLADKSPPHDTIDQQRAVIQFLLAREPDRRVAVFEGGSIGKLAEPPPLVPGQSAAKQGLFTFLLIGSYVNWEAAAKEVYGFASVDAMERAWIDWLRANPAARPSVPPDPDRIPPTDLTARPEPPPGADALSRTKNFLVSAPGADIAGKVAIAAERHRREVAKRWLGKELPDAADPMPIRVKVTAGGAGGATTFTFNESDGKRTPGVKSAGMELHGPLNQLLKSNLPHEVTHVVLATHFGRPLPRWADEGISVLAESEEEQRNHEVRARELLNAGRAIRVSVLFRMTDYPRDSIVLYAQGYSLCHFLLERGAADPWPGGPAGVRPHKEIQYPGGPTGTTTVRFTRGDREPALLAFLAIGMGENTPQSWALAAKEVYRFASLDALEQAWIDSLRTPAAGPRRGPDGLEILEWLEPPVLPAAPDRIPPVRP